MCQWYLYLYQIDDANCVVAMEPSQSDMHVEVSVNLNQHFDFFPAQLRDRIETASSIALSNTLTTRPKSCTRVVWIVQDTYHVTPDVTNPGMLEYTYNEAHVVFSQKAVGVYDALEKANVAALSQFLNTSALAEDEEDWGQYEEEMEQDEEGMGQDEEEVTVQTDPGDLNDFEDGDENLDDDEPEVEIPLRVKNRLRFVQMADTNNIRLEYGDVGWGFGFSGALCLSTRQEMQGVVDEDGHRAALDEKITVAVKRMDLLV
jgi:hypothetical protein